MTTQTSEHDDKAVRGRHLSCLYDGRPEASAAPTHDNITNADRQ